MEYENCGNFGGIGDMETGHDRTGGESAYIRSQQKKWLCFNYGLVKGRIFYRVVNTNRNRKKLRGVLHIDIMDLSLVFSVMVGVCGTVLVHLSVTEQILKQWGQPLEEVIRQAVLNTPVLFPEKSSTLSSRVEDILSAGNWEGEAGEIERVVRTFPYQAYILENQRGIHGFNAVFYGGTLKNMAGQIGDSLFVLPSSIHEAILIPEKEGLCVAELQNMVHDVNRTSVSYDDFLSDNVYYYDREQDTIQIAGEFGSEIKDRKEYCPVKIGTGGKDCWFSGTGNICQI